MDLFQKPKILTFVIIGLLVINLGTLAFLWFHRPARPDHMTMPLREMMDNKHTHGFLEDQLNFNDKQRDDLNKLKDEHHKQMADIQKSIKDLKDNLFEQLKVTPVDSAKINSIASSIGEKQKEIELVTFYHFQKVRALCNEEQKGKFDNIFKEIIKMMEMPGLPPNEMHQGMMHGTPPPP